MYHAHSFDGVDNSEDAGPSVQKYSNGTRGSSLTCRGKDINVNKQESHLGNANRMAMTEENKLGAVQVK